MTVKKSSAQTQPRRSSRVFKQFMAATLQPVQIEEPPTDAEATRVWAALSGQERALLKGLVLGAATADWPFRKITRAEWEAMPWVERGILEDLLRSAMDYRRGLREKGAF